LPENIKRLTKPYGIKCILHKLVSIVTKTHHVGLAGTSQVKFFFTKIYLFFKTLISHYDLGTCFRTWLPVDIFFSESYNLEDFSTYGASKTDGLRVRQMVNYMAELLLEVSY
jgi:hypothetical protein